MSVSLLQPVPFEYRKKYFFHTILGTSKIRPSFSKQQSKLSAASAGLLGTVSLGAIRLVLRVLSSGAWIEWGQVFLTTHSINPLTLRAAKTGLTIWEIFYLQKHFLENIWRRNDDQKLNNNSPSKCLWTFVSFPNYFQKYEKKQTMLSTITLSVNGLNVYSSSPFEVSSLSIYHLIHNNVEIRHGFTTTLFGELWINFSLVKKDSYE